MATKAYLMLKIADEFQIRQQDIIQDLKEIKEVKAVERVDGIYDLLLYVVTPLRLILVANKIKTKPWLRRIHALKLEPMAPVKAPKPALGSPHKVLFLVNVAEEFRWGDCQEWVKDLQTIPEIKYVDKVVGVCDLFVYAIASVRVVTVANKIRTRRWVKQLHVLNIEPVDGVEAELVLNTTTKPLVLNDTPTELSPGYSQLLVPVMRDPIPVPNRIL